MEKRIRGVFFLTILAILAIPAIYSVISPYVSTNKPNDRQYHHISEIWINDTIDWKNVVFVNLGAVGIGTSSPTVKLHVVGDIKANNIIPNSDGIYSLGSDSNMWANIYVKQICLNRNCTARIYYNSSTNSLIIEAPKIELRSTS